MSYEDNIYCSSCLHSNRKMLIVKEYYMKQCYLDIINEISNSTCTDVILVCWECYAALRSFSRFKMQVKNAYTILYEKKKIPIVIEPKTKLTTNKIYNFSLNIMSDNTCEVMQPLNLPAQEIDNIKLEVPSDIDNISIHSDEKQIKIKRKHRKKKKNGIYKEIELNKEEVEEERRLIAEKEEYVNAVFKCDKCLISFTNEEDFKDHNTSKHDLTAPYQCGICCCGFVTEISYRYHTNKHTKRYRCVKCKELCHNVRAVNRHFEIVHVSNEYEVRNKSDNGHIKETTEENRIEPTYPCNSCHKTFRWKTSLRKHAETHSIETGEKRRPYCEPCRMSFTTTSNLQKHVKTSLKHQVQLKLRRLNESNPEDLSTKEKMQSRLEEIRESVVESREMYRCEMCERRFRWKGNLLRHVHSHEARANGELVCEPCNRSFSSIATYQQHMKISKKHVKESDFKFACSECGKRFANKIRLKDHVNWEHLKNYVHTCPVCQKVFKSHTSLYLHKQVVHKKDHVEHLCDHCGKPFPNQAKLRIHITALHSGSAAYSCALCSAKFSWASCLSRHQRRVHRGHGADKLHL